MSAVLEVKDLHVSYGEMEAVRGVDLRAEAGTVTVVLGPNGAGKTTTVRSMAGLQRSTCGSVSLAGHDITRAAPHAIVRRGMVMVPEGRRVFAPLTVHENLLLGAYSNKDSASRTALLAQVFDMFPVLHDRRDGRAGLLSGGEQQMLAFGRAMMADPTIMVMDEPSMGLSPAMVDFIMGAVSAIAERGIGVLMVEQNAAAALPVASRAYVLERGEVVLEGPADEISDHPEVVRAFLGEQQAS
jgi:branched-chain amino acid transport system ATP-binding protein